MPELTIIKIPSSGAPPMLTRIDDSLDGLQGAVGGMIQLVPGTDPLLRTKGVTVYCDEEGLGKGLDVTMQLGPHTLVGPVIFVGFAGEDDISLTAKQIAAIGKALGKRIAVDPRMSRGDA